MGLSDGGVGSWITGRLEPSNAASNGDGVRRGDGLAVSIPTTKLREESVDPCLVTLGGILTCRAGVGERGVYESSVTDCNN